MSDLISRKALLNSIKRSTHGYYPQLYKTAVLDILDLIERQDDAFDLKNVIGQLEKLTDEDCTLNECGARSENCKECIVMKALEIVRSGGVDHQEI